MPICEKTPSANLKKSSIPDEVDHHAEAAQVKRAREQAYFNSYDFDAIEVIKSADEDDDENHNDSYGNGKKHNKNMELCCNINNNSSSSSSSSNNSSSGSSNGIKSSPPVVTPSGYLKRLTSYFKIASTSSTNLSITNGNKRNCNRDNSNSNNNINTINSVIDNNNCGNNNNNKQYEKCFQQRKPGAAVVVEVEKNFNYTNDDNNRKRNSDNYESNHFMNINNSNSNNCSNICKNNENLQIKPTNHENGKVTSGILTCKIPVNARSTNSVGSPNSTSSSNSGGSTRSSSINTEDSSTTNSYKNSSSKNRRDSDDSKKCSATTATSSGFLLPRAMLKYQCSMGNSLPPVPTVTTVASISTSTTSTVTAGGIKISSSSSSLPSMNKVHNGSSVSGNGCINNINNNNINKGSSSSNSSISTTISNSSRGGSSSSGGSCSNRSKCSKSSCNSTTDTSSTSIKVNVNNLNKGSKNYIGCSKSSSDTENDLQNAVETDDNCSNETISNTTRNRIYIENEKSVDDNPIKINDNFSPIQLKVIGNASSATSPLMHHHQQHHDDKMIIASQSHYSTEKSGSSGYYGSNICSSSSVEDHIYSEPMINIIEPKSTCGRDPELRTSNSNMHSRYSSSSSNSTIKRTCSSPYVFPPLQRKHLNNSDCTVIMNGNTCNNSNSNNHNNNISNSINNNDNNCKASLNNRKLFTNNQVNQVSENLRILKSSIANLDRHLKNYSTNSAGTLDQITLNRMNTFHDLTCDLRSSNSFQNYDKIRSSDPQLPTIMEGCGISGGSGSGGGIIDSSLSTVKRSTNEGNNSSAWSEDTDSLVDVDLNSFLLDNNNSEKTSSNCHMNQKSQKKKINLTSDNSANVTKLKTMNSLNGIDNPSFSDDNTNRNVFYHNEDLVENNYKCSKYVNSCPEDAYKVESVHSIENENNSRSFFLTKKYENHLHFQSTREMLEEIRDKLRILIQSTAFDSNEQLIERSIGATTTTATVAETGTEMETTNTTSLSSSSSILPSASSSSSSSSSSSLLAEGGKSTEIGSTQLLRLLPKDLEMNIKSLKVELEEYLQIMNQYNEMDIKQFCTSVSNDQKLITLTKAFERRKSQVTITNSIRSSLEEEDDYGITYEHIKPKRALPENTLQNKIPSGQYLQSQYDDEVCDLGNHRNINDSCHNIYEKSLKCSSDPNFKLKRKPLSEIFPNLNDECYGRFDHKTAIESTDNNRINPISVGGHIQKNLSLQRPQLENLEKKMFKENENNEKLDTIGRWHRNKPSAWELYYGTNRINQSLFGKRGHLVKNTMSIMSYPSSRPESDFTLDLPRAEQLRLKMEKEKRFRQRCRILTTFLSLVFFLLTVMVVSLVLTRGKRMFGSMI